MCACKQHVYPGNIFVMFLYFLRLHRTIIHTVASMLQLGKEFIDTGVFQKRFPLLFYSSGSDGKHISRKGNTSLVEQWLCLGIGHAKKKQQLLGVVRCVLIIPDSATENHICAIDKRVEIERNASSNANKMLGNEERQVVCRNRIKKERHGT